jgi:hypothetical protein
VFGTEVNRREELARFTSLDEILDCKINGSKHMNVELKKIRNVFVAAAAMALALLASPAARADTETYTYQGQSQLNLGGTGVCSPCRVMLSFTVAAPLAPDSTYTWVSSGTGLGTPLDPEPESFDNFGSIFAASNPSSIFLTTDSTGEIYQWEFNISTIAPDETGPGCVANEASSGMASKLSNSLESEDSISVMNCTNIFDDEGEDAGLVNDEGFFINPWTVTTNVTTAPMPEPSTLALLSIGVLLALVKASSGARLRGRKTVESTVTAV